MASRTGILVLIALVLFSFASARELTVGITQTPPLIYTDSSGTVSGVFADVLTYVARKEGWRLQYRKGSLRQCLRWLGSTRIDLLVDLGYSEARNNRFLFSEECVVPTWAQVLVPAASDIETFSDLQHKTIVVEKEDYFWIDPRHGLRHILHELGLDCRVLEVEEYPDVAAVLEAGEADAGVVNRIYADVHIPGSSLRKTGIVFSPVSLRFAFPRGRPLSDTLRSIIDGHVLRLKADPASVYHQSIVTHLRSAGDRIIPTWAKLLALTLVLALTVLAALAAMLRRQVSRKAHAVRMSERQLRSTKRTYRETCELLPVIICETDTDLRITYVNRVGLEVFGYNADDVQRGLYLLDHLLEEHREQAEKDVRGVLSGAPSEPKEYGVRKKDGSLLWVLARASAVHDDSGITGLRLGLFDITDKKQLEERFIQSQKMESIGQLAGGVAHDFNNILSAITGNADLLKMRLEPDAEACRYAEKIMNAALKASSLTRQLLAFARKQDIEMTPMDIHAAIDDAVAMLRHTLDRRITVRKQLHASEHTVLGDAGQIENALLNLGINSRDAMPHGGEITFSTANVAIDSDHFLSSDYSCTPGTYCAVGVVDTGTGMDTDTVKHIFEPFYTTKEPGKGTGLGLASVYGIVKQHSGYITVESEPGKGTSFSLFFPLCSAEPIENDQVRHTNSCNRDVHVLVVDDDQDIRESTVEMLRTLGFRVSSCADGRDAVELYEKHHSDIDLVILDLIMPRMNGLDCLRRLKQINPDVHLLVSSGYSEGSQLADALREGAVGSLEKPFCLAVLTRKMDEILGKGC